MRQPSASCMISSKFSTPALVVIRANIYILHCVPNKNLNYHIYNRIECTSLTSLPELTLDIVMAS